MLTSAETEVLGLSLRVALAAVGAGLIPAVALGYALARLRARWRIVLETIVNLPLVLPPVVTGYILLALLGRRGPAGGWLHSAFGVSIPFTFWAAAIAAGVVGFPLMARAIRLGFEAVDPRLEGASRSLGMGPIATFFRVSLPLAWRGVVAGGVLAFARALGEFGATVMVAGNIAGRTRTIPLAIYTETQKPGGMEAAWRLVGISVALALGALMASELLTRRRQWRR